MHVKRCSVIPYIHFLFQLVQYRAMGCCVIDFIVKCRGKHNGLPSTVMPPSPYHMQSWISILFTLNKLRFKLRLRVKLRCVRCVWATLWQHCLLFMLFQPGRIVTTLHDLIVRNKVAKALLHLAALLHSYFFR